MRPVPRLLEEAIRWYVRPVEAPVRAVLFDFDGTLVDSEYLHHESWLEAVEPWDVAVSWDEYERTMVGISDRRACELFLRLAGMPETEERIAEGRGRKHRAYRRRSVAELSIHADVVAWVRANCRQVPVGVVSSSSIPDVVPILRKQGLAGLLEFVICGDHVGRLKPDPEPYVLALSKLRSAGSELSARECLVFEDSSTGIESARAAGMTVHAVESAADLPSALGTWDDRIRREPRMEPSPGLAR